MASITRSPAHNLCCGRSQLLVEPAARSIQIEHAYFLLGSACLDRIGINNQRIVQPAVRAVRATLDRRYENGRGAGGSRLVNILPQIFPEIRRGIGSFGPGGVCRIIMTELNNQNTRFFLKRFGQESLVDDCLCAAAAFGEIYHLYRVPEIVPDIMSPPAAGMVRGIFAD